MMDKETHLEWVIALFLVGAVIGLGQLLASAERLTTRIIIGRTLSSGGLAIGSASLLQFVPDISLLTLVGISAVIASLGTSFLEKILQHFLMIKK